MPFRDESDMRTLMASAKEMQGGEAGRDELYDDLMTDAEYEAAKRGQADAMNSLQYHAMIDGALGAAGLCPDGYLMLSKAESFLVSQAFEQRVPWETAANALIDLRREGQLFNVLRASVQVAELQRKHEALLADVEGLRDMVKVIGVKAA